MKPIMEYIKQKYNPLSIIVYGSYANGTNNLNSDFDALVISSYQERFHDTSFVEDIQLDVFVYPVSYFESEYDCHELIQIFDGKIVLDTEDIGKALQNRVVSYLENLPHKTEEEIQNGIAWCEKMLARIKWGDAEGMFRWHWVLTDSLEIFCDAKHHTYFGPKKTLQWMEASYPEAFALYQKALSELKESILADWIMYLKNIGCNG